MSDFRRYLVSENKKSFSRRQIRMKNIEQQIALAAAAVDTAKPQETICHDCAKFVRKGKAGLCSNRWAPANVPAGCGSGTDFNQPHESVRVYPNCPLRWRHAAWLRAHGEDVSALAEYWEEQNRWWEEKKKMFHAGRTRTKDVR